MKDSIMSKIEVSFTRRRNWECFPTEKCQKPIGDALETLVIYELGYGGRITKFTKESITVVTNIMSCEDTTEFKGSLESMKPLTDFIQYYALALKNENFQNHADEVLAMTKGIPLLVKMSSGLIVGQSRIKRAIILALLGECFGSCEKEEHIIEVCERLAQLYIKDLLCMYDMIAVENQDFAEVLELASAKPVYNDQGFLVGIA
jgi:hypothetical protein